MTDTDTALHDAPVPVRLKLAALWTSMMFLYVYVDIFTLFKPGTVSDILEGRVWEFDITPTWAFSAMVLLAIPSLMVALSVLLPARAARWSNVVVGALYIPVSAGNVIGETWAYFYLGAALEVALLVLIIRYAWTWPRGR
jgi:hypothetical protein